MHRGRHRQHAHNENFLCFARFFGVSVIVTLHERCPDPKRQRLDSAGVPPPIPPAMPLRLAESRYSARSLQSDDLTAADLWRNLRPNVRRHTLRYGHPRRCAHDAAIHQMRMARERLTVLVVWLEKAKSPKNPIGSHRCTGRRTIRRRLVPWPADGWRVALMRRRSSSRAGCPQCCSDVRRAVGPAFAPAKQPSLS